MKHRMPAACLVLFLLLATTSIQHAVAYSSFYSNRCASCHGDDSPTCDGCHHHGGSISAYLNVDQIPPGDPFTVTLEGGSEGGWIRGRLYDHDNNLIAELCGPTGTGDDGEADPVTFPVTFEVNAPPIEGDYIWEAAYFGGNSSGSGHSETRTPITIMVRGIPTSVPEYPANPNTESKTWQQLKALY